MKAINQISEQSPSLRYDTKNDSDKNIDEKVIEKKKKIPEELDASIAFLLAQLSPEVQELIKKYLPSNSQPNAGEESSISAQYSRPSTATGQANEFGSSKNKDNSDLDAMLLVAAAALPQLAPLQTLTTDNSTSVAQEKNTKLESAGHSKKQPQESEDVDIDLDKDAGLKQRSERQHLTEVGSDKNFAQATANLAQQLVAASLQPTQDQKIMTDLTASSTKSDQINRIQETRGGIKPAGLSTSNGQSKLIAAADKVSATSDGISHKSKSRNEEVADPAQAIQMIAPAVPNLQEALLAQVQQQSQNSSAFQRSAARENVPSSVQNTPGTTEGVKFNMHSLGQDKSVQITGTNQTGYTLRPSDAHVQRVLEKNKNDTLPISIENVSGASGARHDMASYEIGAVSGNETDTE